MAITRWLPYFVAVCGFLACHSRPAIEEDKFSKVVFVCEHGSVKSVIASNWFNRMAAEQQIPFRSISLGISPDKKIPEKVYENLRKDGFDLSEFKPKRFDSAQLSDAHIVIGIGVNLQKLNQPKGVKLENWSDIPPASTNYSASRDAIRKHIQILLKNLNS